jgi:hypothetical protein
MINPLDSFFDIQTKIVRNYLNNNCIPIKEVHEIIKRHSDHSKAICFITTSPEGIHLQLDTKPNNAILGYPIFISTISYLLTVVYDENTKNAYAWKGLASLQVEVEDPLDDIYNYHKIKGKVHRTHTKRITHYLAHYGLYWWILDLEKVYDLSLKYNFTKPEEVKEDEYAFKRQFIEHCNNKLGDIKYEGGYLYVYIGNDKWKKTSLTLSTAQRIKQVTNILPETFEFPGIKEEP